MGLPLFITPVEPEIPSKAAEKTSSGPRSAIRRQRTIHGGPHARVVAENRRRRLLGLIADRDEFVEVFENQGPSPEFVHGPEIFSIASTEALVLENGHLQLRDTPNFERPARHSDLDPLVPESRDPSSFDDRQRELEGLHQIRRELRRIRRRPAPTPPYTETDIAFMARMGRDSPRLRYSRATLTPPRRSPPEGETEAPTSFTRPSLDEPDWATWTSSYAVAVSMKVCIFTFEFRSMGFINLSLTFFDSWL